MWERWRCLGGVEVSGRGGVCEGWRVWEVWRCLGGVEERDGRVRCVGVVKVCGTVLEMGQ